MNENVRSLAIYQFLILHINLMVLPFNTAYNALLETLPAGIPFWHRSLQSPAVCYLLA